MDSELHRRGGDLFVALLDLHPTERAHALADARTTDSEVAAYAAELLEAHEAESPLGGSEMASDGSGSGADSATEPAAGSAAVIGSSIKGYVLREVIGRGGMGAVYLAERDNPPERVAIKFMTLAAGSPVALDRFHQEVEGLARLSHPDVVRYRDSGADKAGRPYLIMDWVDGEPLSLDAASVRSGPRNVARLMARVADAVHHLHQKRVVHRDLKPSNLLLRRGSEEPVVIDLGVARLLQLEDAVQPPTIGLPVGTREYMSPEQAAGAEVDVRSDIYSLGVIVFELLLGELPPPPMAEGLRASGATRRLERSFGADLAAVVAKAMAFDPDHRYGSAERLAADLRNWSRGLPVDAHPTGAPGRLWRLVRRHPIAASLSTAAILGLIVTSLAAFLALRAERHARGRIAEQVEVTEEVTRFLADDVFALASPERLGPKVAAVEIVRAAARGTEQLEHRPAVAVGVHAALVGLFGRLADFDAARHQLELAQEPLASLASDHPQRLDLELESAKLLVRERKLEEGIGALRRWIARAGALEPESGSALLVPARIALGQGLVEANQLAEAEVELRAALLACGSRDSRRFEVRSALAVVRGEMGDVEGAIRELRQTAGDVAAEFGRNDVRLVDPLATLTAYLLENKEPAKALIAGQRAATIARERLAATDPQRLVTLNNYASCLSAGRKYEDAVELRLEVLDGRIARFGSDSGPVLTARANLATNLMWLGRGKEVREQCLLAVESAARVPAHLDVARCMRSVGHTLTQVFDYANARVAYERGLAAARACEGDVVELITYMERALEILPKPRKRRRTGN